MNQKLELISNRKGYLQIDFAFVVLIMLLFFFLIHNMYKQKEDSYEKTILINELNADARDLCFLLSSTKGSPNNWEVDINSTFFVGLKSENFNLSSSKIIFLNDSNNYFDIIDNLDYENKINLEIVGLESNTVYVNLGTNLDNVSVYFAKYSCYSNYNGEVVKFNVEVWV